MESEVTMQEYRNQQYLLKLIQTDPEKHKKVLNLLNQIKSKRTNSEKLSIKISTLQKDLKFEPIKLKSQKQTITKHVREINQDYINQLRIKLDEAKLEAGKMVKLEEKLRKDNKLLISEHSMKQKTQEALVQFLNDAMAEKAEMQIQVNRTKMDTKQCENDKAKHRNNFETYTEVHNNKLSETKKHIKNTEVETETTSEQIIDCCEKIDKASIKNDKLDIQLKELFQKNNTVKVHLQEHLRRISELETQKTQTERAIKEKSNIRNLQVTTDCEALGSNMEQMRLEYTKKLTYAKSNKEVRNTSLHEGGLEYNSLLGEREQYDLDLGEKRAELDEVADYMRGIQGLTEDIRTSLEKKQKAKTRLRNEIGAVTAELRRTVDEHEQEKAMLEILKNELETETEIKLKEKNQLELEFKKLQYELEKHVNLVETSLDSLEHRYTGKTEEIKKTNTEINQVSTVLKTVTEDYCEGKQKLTDRRQNVKTFTETNLKNTQNFSQGIKTLSQDEIELTEERDVITEPYKKLILEHSDETSTYDSLKSDVLALNAELRRANEEIAEYNKNIFDMQEPRRKLRKEIFERRSKMEGENGTSHEKIYMIERRTYSAFKKMSPEKVPEFSYF